MIKRSSSKIADSIVNASHEEHFNVSKAIRDDAPITNDTTVIKSVNFEPDGDGAYILRKPLIKQKALTSNQTLLANKTDILTYDSENKTIRTRLGRRISPGIIRLKFYDNALIQHTVDCYYFIGSLSVPWLTQLTHKLTTAEASFFTATIDHRYFLLKIDVDDNRYVESEPTATTEVARFSWTLQTGDIYFSGLQEENWTASETYPTYEAYQYANLTMEDDIETLKFIVKVYQDDDNVFVFELVSPEINTITSGTDVQNSNTLDINLLLNNPYAIRDLYGYGYVSCTKILPYVLIDDDFSTTLDSLRSYKIYKLTEDSDIFQMLISTNPEVFDKKYLILKAFITTAITTTKYYCRWEMSKDGGITWEDCPEFLTQNQIINKVLLDMTSAEFEDIVASEGLEDATGYLSEVKVTSLTMSSEKSANDSISNRPDVLILPNPNLSYQYRFKIYVDTEKETLTPTEVVTTDTLSSFSSTSGDIGDSGKIAYICADNGTSVSAPTVDEDTGVLYLFPGNYHTPATTDAEERYYSPQLGNTLKVYVKDAYVDEVKLKTVKIKLASSYTTNSTTYDVGSYMGVSDDVYQFPDEYTQPEDSLTGEYYTLSIALQWTIGRNNLSYRHYNANNTAEKFVFAGNTKSYNVYTYDNNYKQLVITNLSRWAIGEDTTDLSQVQEDTGLNTITDIAQIKLAIESITVQYTSNITYTSTYLTSTTGAFQVAYSNITEYPEDLTNDRNRLFSGEFYYNKDTAQLLIYEDNYLYMSNPNSSIIQLMNTIDLFYEITKVISWRGYLLAFTKIGIYLLSYDNSTGTYNIKTISTTIGVLNVDADTVIPILNSIYFKSGNKIYKLVPNLYSSSDNILNIHQISTGINNILEKILNSNEETHNFAYANADYYAVYIPIEDVTYCLNYDFIKQTWSLLQYPVYLTKVETISNLENYLYDDSNLYYFDKSLDELLHIGLKQYIESENLEDDNENVIYWNEHFEIFTNAIPYSDYLTQTPLQLITLVIENNSSSYANTFSTLITQIPFSIDFGQKSSNYTVDKQFLESKFIFATLTAKDTVPVTLDILTDGVSRPLHWDANTSGALWKTSLDDSGILNTNFVPDGADYNGIFRQLIVKYSGRGKTVRHVISGNAKSLFKFYSLDVRARILPKKR